MRFIFSALLAVFFAGQTFATPIQLVAKIDSGQVVPPTTSLAFGTGAFVYDAASNILAWAIVVTDALFTSPETSALLHEPAAVGFVGPSISSLGLGSLTFGAVDLDDVCVDASLCEADLLSGLWYAQVSTESYPGGEIRGQILPVAEPSIMLLLGISGLALFDRRQHRV